MIESFLTDLPENVFILITSRSKDVFEKASKVEVNYFTNEQARLFFEFSLEFTKETYTKKFTNETAKLNHDCRKSGNHVPKNIVKNLQ